MEPFKVTWRLRTPICISGFPTHLDGLLAWATVDRKRRAEPESNYLLAKDDLPLERVRGEDGAQVWKASILAGIPDLEPDLVHMIRRTDENHFAKNQGVLFQSRLSALSTGTGQFRNYNLRQAIQWFSTLHAYGVGDIAAVRDLLGDLRGIGKITRNGFGTIVSTEVTPDPTAAELWRQRNLPESLSNLALDGHVPGTGCISSPYWDRAAWQDILAWSAPVQIPASANLEQSSVTG